MEVYQLDHSISIQFTLLPTNSYLSMILSNELTKVLVTRNWQGNMIVVKIIHKIEYFY